MKVTVELASLKKAIDNVSKFVGETHIVLVNDELIFREISSDSVAYYEAIIKDVAYDKPGFDVFINATHFGRLLKSLGKAEQVTLDYSKGKLVITGDANTKSFQIPVYVDDIEPKLVPDFDQTIKGKILAGKLCEIMSSVQAANKDMSTLIFEMKDKVMTVSSSTDAYKYTETIDEFTTDDTVDETIMCNVGWLTTVSDCLINDTVRFEYSKDKPTVIIDEGSDKIRQRFVLAPRIER